MARHKCPHGHPSNEDAQCDKRGCDYGPPPRSQVGLFHSHDRKGLRTERVQEFGGLFGPKGWNEWVDVHCTCGEFMGREEEQRFTK
jgi:hypothetical protein